MISKPSVRVLIAAATLGCARPGNAPAQSDAPHDALAAPFLSSEDPVVRSAGAALAAGLPWRATELLDSAFRDSTRRTVEASLLAATAAATWGGWGRVEAELASAPWLDTLQDGAGRELLARAALARGADSLARVRAARAVSVARSDRDRGTRLVLLARALDRQALGDSAAASYRRAARYLPAVGDWLALRAAGATADASRRERDYANVTIAAARPRIRHTEAQARERWRDYAGAARAYAELGERAQSLRLRLLATPDSATRSAVRSETLALLATQPRAAEVRVAVALLDSSLATTAPLNTREELVVARAASGAGLLARAASGFARAERGSSLDARDRYGYGMVLSRLGRDGDAATQLARVPAGSPLGATAAYQGARSLLRAGKGPASRTALRAVLRTFPRDTSAASLSLFLLADLATDDGRDSDARSAFAELARTYPTSVLAPLARFRAAIIAYAAGSFAPAARELEALVERYPRSTEVLAARYWAARARTRLGDGQRARELWRNVMSADPLSYYSMLSARRLGVDMWRPAPAPDSVSTTPALERAVERAELLEALGMATEEGFEYDQMLADAGRTPDSLLAAADALRERGEVSRAMVLARRALAASATRDTRLLRLLYPLAYGDVIRAEAAARRVDPRLVAAIIHQESSFNPRATSRAGALGLMQLLPNVGAAVAKSRGLAGYERVLLYQPDVNVHLGVAHLDAMLDQYPDVAYALAAYNAGGSPVRRWRQKRGSDDPELFIERVPYDETRDYVRIVLRNQATYAMLYGW